MEIRDFEELFTLRSVVEVAKYLIVEKDKMRNPECWRLIREYHDQFPEGDLDPDEWEKYWHSEESEYSSLANLLTANPDVEQAILEDTTGYPYLLFDDSEMIELLSQVAD